ncbi:hypothetical protein EAF00_006546 [Botryotinia globosa]|nr:hypothetical protein EAF00_006546 [Botryotinia globosa]
MEDSRSSSLTSGITFNNVQIRDSICDPDLDALVECYKDGNNSRLDESHANSVGNVGIGEPSTIEHVDGGNYNRVIGLSFQIGSEIQRRILRIPRRWNAWSKQTDIQNQAEIIMWLQRFAFLRVPKILAIDTTAENSLKSPFVLQERVQGISLDDLFFKIPAQLSMSTRLEVVKAVAKFIIKLERTALDKPGRLIGTILYRGLQLPWLLQHRELNSVALLRITWRPHLLLRKAYRRHSSI